MNQIGNQNPKFVSFAKYAWLISLTFLILTLLTVIIKIFRASDISALHYNVVLGVTQIGSKYQLLKVPATGLIITAINYLLAKLSVTRQDLMPFLLSLLTLFINFILFISAIFLFNVS